MKSLSTCLWFNDQAEAAAAFYVSLFPNSRILDSKNFLEGAPRPAGSVLLVRFSLNGTKYTALNGGPEFHFSPAVSMVATCDTQEEVDFLWTKLSEGGQEGQCGSLADRFEVSWQILPRVLLDLLNTENLPASQRVWSALWKMTKLDFTALQRAYGES